ncbi:MAG: CHASE2 domain-containing protein [Leptolyngbya sp. SIOISBB]|nr:CHASE2 domain-containing protein [Leptolyngbya sp. SIOISBB]
MVYQLNIQKIQDVCLFELTWGRTQRLKTQIPYPEKLETCYRQWQRAYLNFYRQALRGRAGVTGQMVATATVDWHQHLVDAEGQLLLEFHRWLRQGELTDIRRTLILAAKTAPVDLFLTCNPIEMARLPWETWEIGAEYGGAPIRMSRSPVNIPVSAAPMAQRGKTRVLAIIGEENNLNLSVDREALKALEHLLDVTFIGWTPGQDAAALRTAICQVIADPQGWDVLFFAGHSNEADVVAGHIYVAPNTALSIHELKSYLQAAQANGLQFALFNSCSGITIADALIELGLSQVAIMREPIHNRVAHAFLLTFLQSLARHEDAHSALQAACRHLKLEQHLTFPSAHLVPSLFRHPDSVPFQIPERGWRQELRRWLPGKRQAIALSSVFLLSLIPGVQSALLSGRLLGQAMYRNLTGQMPTAPPEVVLIQIDSDSRQAAPELIDISPIDQSYLARVVDRLVDQDADVIGIDYLLDLYPTEQSPILAETLRSAVSEANTWLVFSARLENEQEQGVNPQAEIIDSAWALEGYTNAPRWYMTLPWQEAICQTTCPFGFLLALTAQHKRTDAAPTPELSRQTALRPELVRAASVSGHAPIQTLIQRRLSLVTVLASQVGSQSLRPILDFSLPPDRVFQRVSAYELLDGTLDEAEAEAIANASVVLVGSLLHTEDRVDQRWQELTTTPGTIAYWRRWGRDIGYEPIFGGVESLAYEVHHHLRSHLVTPVPTAWLVALFALAAPSLSLYGLSRLSSRQQVFYTLVGISVGFGIVSLQTAVSMGLLMPWLLPGAVIWIYGLPVIRRLPKS